MTINNEQNQSKDILKVKDLSFYYGDFQALKDISLDIEANKVTALIGPSGCGKILGARDRSGGSAISRWTWVLAGWMASGPMYSIRAGCSWIYDGYRSRRSSSGWADWVYLAVRDVPLRRLDS